MAGVEQLRYVRLGTRDLARASDFAVRVLGLQIVSRTDKTAAFRSDFRDHTLVYVEGDPAAQAIGFEVHAAFDATLERLAQAGYSVVRADAAAAAERKARELATLKDPAGNTIELVTRPQNSGLRFHATRDCGVTGLAGVALRAANVELCERLWCDQLGARVADWAGSSAYIGIDDAHHRLAYHSAQSSGVLAIEYEVEGVDQLMQNSYFLQSSQIRIVHGPGRRPASGQLFITFEGPDGVLYSFVAEGEKNAVARRPRQFAAGAASYCAWGSPCMIKELSAP